jgi:hypothetical protein
MALSERKCRDNGRNERDNSRNSKCQQSFLILSVHQMHFERNLTQQMTTTRLATVSSVTVGAIKGNIYSGA